MTTKKEILKEFHYQRTRRKAEVTDWLSKALDRYAITVRADERDVIWGWCDSNDWRQVTPVGEVRAIDCDELAEFMRERDALRIVGGGEESEKG